MKKLSLRITELKVESFETTILNDPRKGTIKGYESYNNTNCFTCPNTCEPSCPRSCECPINPDETFGGCVTDGSMCEPTGPDCTDPFYTLNAECR